MPSLGGWEWVILAVVALVLFGGAKVASLGKNAGKAIREFKEETQAIKSDGAPTAPVTPAAPVATEQAVTPEDPAGQR
jgi:sec-independent protein translocase protein TatA